MAVKKVEITYGSLPPGLRELLQEIAVKNDKKHVHAEPFSRYGNSGSELYLVFLTKQNEPGVPYLLKTFKKKKEFREEERAIKNLNGRIADAKGACFPGKKLSGILTEYHGEDEQKGEVLKPTTFKDIIITSKNLPTMTSAKKLK
jgi:hypothetical protein